MSPLRTNQFHSSDNCYNNSKFIRKNDTVLGNHMTNKLPVLTHITCLQSNLQSISNKFPELASLVDQYHPNIIGITESWCSDDVYT